jgi:hypothetical protein
MSRTKGLILVYTILGTTFFAIVAILLIPVRVQHAAEPIDPTVPSPTEAVKDYVSAVGKLMYLPDGEVKVVEVVDVDKKKQDQPFFAIAQNGDQLLIYSSKVILYRPAENKIVEFAHIRP